MKLHKLSPILWTKDIHQTISFYEDVLGFKAKSNFPDFASLTRDQAEIMFVVPQADEDNKNEKDNNFFPKAILTGSIFIYIEEVDLLWASVKDKATIKTSLANRAYFMRDFSILDNNGYELVFGQDISK
jgi:catechol 2,3-dioxygenase-like lactoylglutathione lyase family enzyme